MLPETLVARWLETLFVSRQGKDGDGTLDRCVRCLLRGCGYVAWGVESELLRWYLGGETCSTDQCVLSGYAGRLS